jgi:hypothetical protein
MQKVKKTQIKKCFYNIKVPDKRFLYFSVRILQKSFFFLRSVFHSPVIAADRRRHENRRRRVLDHVLFSAKTSGIGRKIQIVGVFRRSHFNGGDNPGRVLAQIRTLTIRLFRGERETLLGAVEYCEFDGVNLKKIN